MNNTITHSVQNDSKINCLLSASARGIILDFNVIVKNVSDSMAPSPHRAYHLYKTNQRWR